MQALFCQQLTPQDQIQQVVVVQLEQFLKLIKLSRGQSCQMLLVESFKNNVQFKQATPAVPPDFVQFSHDLIARNLGALSNHG